MNIRRGSNLRSKITKGKPQAARKVSLETRRKLVVTKAKSPVYFSNNGKIEVTTTTPSLPKDTILFAMPQKNLEGTIQWKRRRLKELFNEIEKRSEDTIHS